MVETPAGFPRPVISDEACIHCGLCHRVCSGLHYRFPLPEDVDRLFRPPPRRVLIAAARDPEIHALGQSGGAITAILTWMMRTGRISHALVTTMPSDGSLRPKARYATTPDELLDSVGSKYCLNPVNAALADWPTPNSGVAAVGLGCHAHGLANLSEVLPHKWRDAFKLVIGLFCLQADGYLGIEYLLRHGRRKPARRVFFRRKSQPGERGSPCIEYQDGTVQEFPEDFLWRFFNDKFVPLRCSFCFDQLNCTSDLAVGDPNGYPEDVVSGGRSVLAVYTRRGEETVEAARADGAIEFVESDAETMWRGQVEASGRKGRVLGSYTRWKSLGRPVPELPVVERARPVRCGFSTRMNLGFLYRLEKARSRGAAYWRLMAWKTIWKWYSRLRKTVRRSR
jgi:coenzyme F420 hydrogenase subunit beta